MRHTVLQACRIAALTALVLLSWLAPAGRQTLPGLTAEDVPTPEEIAVLQELEEWVRPLAAGALGEQESLATRIRQRTDSFELFRLYSPPAVKEELLAKLPYGGLTLSMARRWGVDALLLVSVMEAESGFRPNVVSDQGAMGLMQVLPSTASSFGARDLMAPRDNVEVGARYLARLLNLYQGDVVLALAAYNSGPANVARYNGVPPFQETRRYLDKVLRRYVALHRRAWEISGRTDWLLL